MTAQESKKERRARLRQGAEPTNTEINAIVRRYFRVSLLAFVVVVVAVVVGAAVLTVQANRQRQQGIDSQVSSCKNQADFRTTFEAVLTSIAHPPARPPGSAPAVDFSKVPGFSKLDPDQQSYLRNLTRFLSTPTPNTTVAEILADYMKRFPIPDCVALKRQLEHGHVPRSTPTTGG